MWAALLSLALLGASAADAPKASKDTLELVQGFLKANTADLPPEAVPSFLAVDTATLPAKLRPRVEAKKAELLALKKISDGKTKSPLRRLGNDKQAECAAPLEPHAADMLKEMGFEEIDQPEQEHLEVTTNCTICEMSEEFTLTLVKRPPKKKGGKLTVRYFYSASDPIMNLVAAYRAGKKSTGTAFFGISMTPKCR